MSSSENIFESNLRVSNQNPIAGHSRTKLPDDCRSSGRRAIQAQLGRMRNAISVDVEEYFHAASLDPVAGPAKWHKFPSRVESSTHKILNLFDRLQAKGTFFVLGYVARRNPSLVREIASRGHEIASHGYAHRIAYEQTPKQFARDISRSKLLLEDICGARVIGYRAPSFSINDQNPWAHDELIRAGYRYDSSLYPIRHPRYGNREKPLLPFFIRREEGSLLVLPLAVSPFRILGKDFRLPVAGGAYWRFFPRNIILRGLQSINRTTDTPFICYFHPWEIDPDQPRFQELPVLTKIRHYKGLSNYSSTVEYFLKNFTFDSIQGCYALSGEGASESDGSDARHQESDQP